MTIVLRNYPNAAVVALESTRPFPIVLRQLSCASRLFT